MFGYYKDEAENIFPRNRDLNSYVTFCSQSSNLMVSHFAKERRSLKIVNESFMLHKVVISHAHIRDKQWLNSF